MGQDEQKLVGYVYFIWARDVNRIKIGYSAEAPNNRFINLNIASPVVLEKHALMRGSVSKENQLHKRFRKLHKKGEWFRAGASLLKYIAENARNWDELLAEENREREAATLAGVAPAVPDLREMYYYKRTLVNPVVVEKKPKPATKAKRVPPKTRRFGPLQEKLDALVAEKAREAAAKALPPSP